MSKKKDQYPSDAAERFQLRLPPGLRDRIKAYAERHGRSMNTEIVRVLEREYPEPWPIERRVQDLIDMLAVLKAGRVEALDRLLHEIEETMEGVITGRVQGLSAEERGKIEKAWDSYREELQKWAWIDEPELDPEEQRTLDRVGKTPKFTGDASGHEKGSGGGTKGGVLKSEGDDPLEE